MCNSVAPTWSGGDVRGAQSHFNTRVNFCKILTIHRLLALEPDIEPICCLPVTTINMHPTNESADRDSPFWMCRTRSGPLFTLKSGYASISKSQLSFLPDFSRQLKIESARAIDRYVDDSLCDTSRNHLLTGGETNGSLKCRRRNSMFCPPLCRPFICKHIKQQNFASSR